MDKVEFQNTPRNWGILWNLFAPEKVVSSHYDSLQHSLEGARLYLVYITYLIIPIIISGYYAIYHEFILSVTGVAVITPTIAILGGFMFNSNILILNLIKSTTPLKTPESRKERLDNLNFLFNNVGYTILICILTLMFSIVSLIEIFWLMKFASFMTWFLLGHVTLSFFIVMSRLFKVFNSEFENEKSNVFQKTS